MNRTRLSASAIRSQFVHEVAAGLVAAPRQRLRQVRVSLREQGNANWPVSLYASSTDEGIDAVVASEVALGMINPSAALTLAYRGRGSWTEPQPVRMLTVIPSFDRVVFVVPRASGLTCVEEIAARRLPLRIGVRGQRDHHLNALLAHVAVAAGFTLADLAARGGELRYSGTGPHAPGGPQLAALASGGTWIAEGFSPPRTQAAH